jgi:hypothetical protein
MNNGGEIIITAKVKKTPITQDDDVEVKLTQICREQYCGEPIRKSRPIVFLNDDNEIEIRLWGNK